MKYRINQTPLIVSSFIIFTFFAGCSIDNFSDTDSYPKGTIIVTVHDSLDNPMINRGVDISGNIDFQSISKYSDSEGKVIFDKVPISHGAHKSIIGSYIPAGNYSYDIGVDYRTDDCCYILRKEGVIIIEDPMNVSIKLPEDLIKITGILDVLNPENSCTCAE